MAETVRPEDIPDDTDPVCSRCKMPASFNGQQWQHAEPADAAFCSLIYGGNRA
jgi:hypothetical protein